MGVLKLEVLSESEVETVHNRSLRILAEPGIRVGDAECRGVLAKAGAAVDDTTDIVRMPPSLVEEALDLAPARFEMHRQDGAALEAGGERRIYGSLVIDPWIVGFPAGKPRRPLLSDVIRNTRLGEAHPLVDMIYRMDMPPADVPQDSAYIKSLEAFATNTTKHLVAAPASLTAARDWLDVAQILVGGRRLAEHPIITFSVPMTTPLTLDEVNCEILKMGVRQGIPVSAQTEPLAGTTAPLSFAGGLLMGNTENLFLVALAQLLRPGAPISYSVGHGLADLHSGGVIFYNADKMLWQIADIQMARHYCLPIWSSLGGSMVADYGMQCGVEQALLMMPAVACGADILNGLGSCYNACGMSAEMIVIQADLAQQIERIGEGIDTSGRKLACESIAAVGPGGNFLTEDLTLEMLRSDEFYTRGIFDRRGEGRVESPEDTLLTRAHARVEDLLAAHKPALCERTVEEIHRWARQREEALGVGLG